MLQVGKRRKKTPGAKHKPSHHFCGHFRGPDSSDKSTGVQRADLWRIGDRAASMRWQKGYAMLCRYADLRIATACDNTSVATKIAKWQLRSRRIGTEVQNSSILVATHCNINSFDRCGCETRTEWVESTNLSSAGSLSQVVKTNHMQVLQGLQGWRLLKYIEPRIYIWNHSMEIQWNTKIPWNVEVSCSKGLWAAKPQIGFNWNKKSSKIQESAQLQELSVFAHAKSGRGEWSWASPTSPSDSNKKSWWFPLISNGLGTCFNGCRPLYSPGQRQNPDLAVGMESRYQRSSLARKSPMFHHTVHLLLLMFYFLQTCSSHPHVSTQVWVPEGKQRKAVTVPEPGASCLLSQAPQGLCRGTVSYFV